MQITTPWHRFDAICSAAQYYAHPINQFNELLEEYGGEIYQEPHHNPTME